MRPASTRLIKRKASGVYTPNRVCVLVGGNYGGEVLRPPTGKVQATIDRKESGLTAEVYEYTHKRHMGAEIWACPYSVMFDYIINNRKLPPFVTWAVERSLEGKQTTRTIAHVKTPTGISGAAIQLKRRLTELW